MTIELPAHIRRARRTDLDALVALEEASFACDRLSRAQYLRHLVSPSARVLVAIRRKRLAGSAVLFFRHGARVARLYSLATAADARGCGIGSALVRGAEEAARRRGCRALHLEVRVDNGHAIALYERMGYAVIGTLADYYEDGGDARRYGKALRQDG